MLRTMMKSKLHRLTVTGADLNYEGSLTLDAALMEAAGILPNEQVQVVNLNNGTRLITYAIPGERDGGSVRLNGAAARLGAIGDRVIVITYALIEDAAATSHVPTVVFVDDSNRIKHVSRGPEQPLTPP